jgi:Uncharacterized membrane protein
MFDPNLQLDLALRLIGAAILGAGIGFERERHDHPAGIRTQCAGSLMRQSTNEVWFRRRLARMDRIRPSNSSSRRIPGRSFVGWTAGDPPRLRSILTAGRRRNTAPAGGCRLI